MDNEEGNNGHSKSIENYLMALMKQIQCQEQGQEQCQCQDQEQCQCQEQGQDQAQSSESKSRSGDDKVNVEINVNSHNHHCEEENGPCNDIMTTETDLIPAENKDLVETDNKSALSKLKNKINL